MVKKALIVSAIVQLILLLMALKPTTIRQAVMTMPNVTVIHGACALSFEQPYFVVRQADELKYSGRDEQEAVIALLLCED